MPIRRILFFCFIFIIIGVTFWWERNERFWSSSNPPSSSRSLPVPQNSFPHTLARHLEPSVVTIFPGVQKSPDALLFQFGDSQEEIFRRLFNASPDKFRKASEPLPQSGVIIDPAGYILTTYKGLPKNKKSMVLLADGNKLVGEWVGGDNELNIAILRVYPEHPLSFLKLGDSDQIRVGDWVVAAGAPFGLTRTLTSGIVSARRQTVRMGDQFLGQLIQTDAPINLGNSGGPLVDVWGNLIGVNVSFLSPNGMFGGVGFAVPVNRIKSVLPDLIKKGKVVRSWIGVEMLPMDDAIAFAFGLENNEGVLINMVFDESPAAVAGILRGDILHKFNGEIIRSPSQAKDIISTIAPGTHVNAEVWRDQAILNFQIQTAHFPGAPEIQKRLQDANPPDIRETLNLGGLILGPLQDPVLNKEVSGLRILEVGSNDRFSNSGLKKGDILISINRKPVPNLDQLEAAWEKLKRGQGFLFEIYREDRFMYLSVPEKG